MVQMTTKLSRAYQITLPSALRKALHLEVGDEIEMEETKKGFLLRKAETKEERIKRAFVELERLKVEREKTMTPEQKRIAEMTKGWTVNQYHEYFDNLPETKAYMKEKYGVEVA